MLLQLCTLQNRFKIIDWENTIISYCYNINMAMQKEMYCAKNEHKFIHLIKCMWILIRQTQYVCMYVCMYVCIYLLHLCVI